MVQQGTAVYAVAPGPDEAVFATDAGVWRRLPGQVEFLVAARPFYRLPPPLHANITRLAFAADGRSIALIKEIEGEQHNQDDDEKVLERWDATGHAETVRIVQTHEFRKVSFQPGGAALTAVSRDQGSGQAATVVRSAEGVVVAHLAREYGSTADGHRVTGVSQTGDSIIETDGVTALVWDVAAQRSRPFSLSGRLREVSAATIAPEGRFFALYGTDQRGGRAILVSAVDDREAPKFLPQGSVREGPDGGDAISEDEEFNILQMDLSADGQRLAVLYTYAEQFARVWDVATGRDVSPGVLKGLPQASSMTVPDHMLLSPAGRYLVLTHDETIALLDLSEGEAATPRQLSEHTAMTSLTFSSDDRYLAVGGDHGTLHIFDTRRLGDEIALLKHEGPITAAAFSADDSRVAVATTFRDNVKRSTSSVIRVLLLRPTDLLAEANSRLSALQRAGRSSN
jgi:WD40 repeat protein